MPNYPDSLDSLTNPASSDPLSSPAHSTQHSEANDILEAVEAKLGTGDSTPTTPGHVLTVTSAGVTEYAAQTILSHTVTLTDAQVKALPTTAVEIVPAPGADLVIVPILAFLFLTQPSIYTNVSANASFNLVWPSAGDATIYADAGLLSSDPSFVALHGASFDNGGSQYGFAFDSAIVNKKLSIDGNNPAMGNFTGGGAGNSLRVTVLYTVVDVS